MQDPHTHAHAHTYTHVYTHTHTHTQRGMSIFLRTPTQISCRFHTGEAAYVLPLIELCCETHSKETAVIMLQRILIQLLLP